MVLLATASPQHGELEGIVEDGSLLGLISFITILSTIEDCFERVGYKIAVLGSELCNCTVDFTKLVNARCVKCN